MILWTFPFVATFLASLLGSAAADADLSADERILNKLQFGTKYNKLARPPPDYNATNIVDINFTVVKILDIDEVGQTMSLEGFTRMVWNDRRLAWANKFNEPNNNVSNIYLPRSSVWIPDVVVQNTMEHNENNYKTFLTAVMANGRVYSSIPFCSKTFCDINMQYFPFDTQTCQVSFTSWSMKKEDLELRLLSKNISDLAFDIDRKMSFSSDEYCITNTEFTVTPKEKVHRFQEAVFSVSIQRKPLFYVMNLIVPSFLIIVICVFSFFLPPESGERLSLNITLMLALTVFLQIVAANTPAQSDNVPILTLFFSAVVALSAVSTIGSMFQIYCNFRGQACPTVDNAAIRLVFLCRLGGGSRGGSGRRKNNGNFETVTSDVELRVPEPKCGDRDADESEPCVRSAGQPAENEWLTIGRRLDNGLFVLMLMSTVALGLFIGFVRSPDYVAC